MPTTLKHFIQIGVFSQVILWTSGLFAEAPSFTHRRHPVLGQVTINREDISAYRTFESTLDMALAVARDLGVTDLPIQRTTFNAENIDLGFFPLGRRLSIGSLPPRNRLNNRNIQLASLHEIAHAVFLQALANRVNVEFLIYYSANNHEIESKVFIAYQEFFADMFSQLILRDPVGISIQEDEFNNWFNQLSTIAREQFGFPAAVTNQSFSSYGLFRRNLTGAAHNRCDLKNPDVHLWYDTSRRLIWDILFHSNAYRARNISTAQMLNVLIEFGDRLLGQIRQNRVAMAQFVDYPAPTSNSELLSRPIDINLLPEDYFDYALRDYLRARFR